MTQKSTKSYVYKITNILNNKIYIGKSNNPEVRFQQHQKNYNKTAIGYALQKYSVESFLFEILAEYDTEEEAYKDEEFLVDFYDCIVPNGYNMTRGGVCSIGGANGRDMSGENNPMYGKRHSEEAKQKMREKAIGRPVAEETKEKLRKAMTGTKRPTNSGLNNKKAKPQSYYAEKPTPKADFKKTCSRMGWNFEDFEMIKTDERASNGAIKFLFINKNKTY